MDGQPQKRLMRIQELAKRAGVSKSTIHYYMEEKLLPPPIKINRTSALYDETYVRRIRLIRGLQQKAFLPLDRIKRLLDRIPDGEMLENILLISAQYAEWMANATPAVSLWEAEAAAEFGFEKETLQRLEQLGVLHPVRKSGSKVYHPEDVEILRILRQMSERGFTPSRGWQREALTMYVEAADELAEKEVEHLFQKMEDGLHPQDAQDLFTGEDLFLRLFLWMRRKAMRKAFTARVKRMKASAGPQKREPLEKKYTEGAVN